MSASTRFADETLAFKENCFHRISMLHFRAATAYKDAFQAIGREKDEGFDVDDIRVMHVDWDLDTSIDECVESLTVIRNEAKEYMTLAQIQKKITY